jgi:hypothetical protein
MPLPASGKSLRICTGRPITLRVPGFPALRSGASELNSLAIMTAIRAREFRLGVSMVDLVTWLGDGDNDIYENENLKIVLDTLGIAVDLRALYAAYFEKTSIGSGDVYAFRPNKESKNVFAVDMYRGLTDQMDIVSLAVGCEEQCLSIVRRELRSFFDSASCQVHYEEASYSAYLHSMLDQSTYPVIIEESGYEQKLHEAHG